MLIDTLIDKRDNYDLVRDQIAAILANETANQMQLATDAGKDPELWRLKVFTERSTPWDNGKTGDLIVNVWFDNANVDRRSSNNIENQKFDGTFNIDVIGYGVSSDTAQGHESGDEKATREATRGITLVRNMIMANIYTYLDMRGVVWGRETRGISMFQPQLDNRQARHVMGARLALDVSFNEYSPQNTPAKIDYLATTIERAEDGSVLAQVDFNFL